MIHSNATPEDGITGYVFDHTQGPACALACAASTVWRNYFVTVEGETGQRADRQLNTLEDLQKRLPAGLLNVRNGYSSSPDVASLSRAVDALSEDAADDLRESLRVGVQWDAEVTDCRESYAKGPDGAPPGVAAIRPEDRATFGSRAGWATRRETCAPVTQVFSSALALGSTRQLREWRPLAQLILDAAYDACLCAARLNAARGGSRRVYLTLLGGGAFGNDIEWIVSAMRRALARHADSGLTVIVVEHGRAPWTPKFTALAGRWTADGPEAGSGGADGTAEGARPERPRINFFDS